MKIIKKQSNWHLYSLPIRPYPPKIPSKTIDEVIDIMEMEQFTLADIKLSKEYINQGFTINDLSFRASGYYDDSKIIVSLTKNIPNPHYDKQLAFYERDKKVNKVELDVYKKELENYQLWKIQEEDKILQKQLEQAQKFLKKHNKI